MPETPMDQIRIEVEATADSADKKINDLVSSLKKLKDSVSKFDVSKLSQLKDALSGVSREMTALGDASGKVEAAATAMARLKEASGARINKNLSTQIRDVALSCMAFTEQTVNNVERVTEALSRLSEFSMPKGAGFATFGSEVEQCVNAVNNFGGSVDLVKDAVGMLTENTDRVSGSVSNTGAAVRETTSALTKFGNGAMTVAKGLVKIGSGAISTAGHIARFAVSMATAPLRSFATKLGHVASAFKRILFYRTIRSVLREISEGFREGINNLYQWSKLQGGEFAQSMDRAASSLAYFKNSIGAAVAPLINALVPVLEFVIDKLVSFINLLNQFFAVLTGASYWTKAIYGQREYAAATNASAAATKKLHDYMLGIDELNVFRDNGSAGGSGGGAGTNLDYNNMFENETVFDSKIKKFAESIREAITTGNWRGVGEIIGNTVSELFSADNLNLVATKFSETVNGIVDFANGFFDSVRWEQLGQNLAEAVVTFFEKVDWADVWGLAKNVGLSGLSFFGGIATGIMNKITGENYEAPTKQDWEEMIRSAFSGEGVLSQGIVPNVNLSPEGSYLASKNTTGYSTVSLREFELFMAQNASAIDSYILANAGKVGGVPEGMSAEEFLANMSEDVYRAFAGDYGKIVVDLSELDVKTEVPKYLSSLLNPHSQFDDAHYTANSPEEFLALANNSESLWLQMQKAWSNVTPDPSKFEEISEELEDIDKESKHVADDTKKNMGSMLTSLVSGVTTFGKSFVESSKTSAARAIKSVSTFAESAADKFRNVGANIGKLFGGSEKKSLQNQAEESCSKTQTVFDGLKDTLSTIASKTAGVVENILGGEGAKFKLEGRARELVNAIKTQLLPLASWLLTNVTSKVSAALSSLFGDKDKTSLTKKAADAVTGIVNEFSKVVGGVQKGFEGADEAILAELDKVAVAAGEGMKRIMSAISVSIKGNDLAPSVSSAFSGPINTIMNGFQVVIEEPFNAINKLISYLKGIRIGAKAPFVDLQPVTPPIIGTTANLYASGGFPSSGEIFVAREDGIPEMVGRIGNQAAVANNGQIEEGIARATERANEGTITALYAIAAQLVQAIEDNTTEVIIGDDQIGRANDRYKSKSGTNGSRGVFAYAR